MSLRVSKYAALVAVFISLLVLASGCGLIGDDDSGSGARITQLRFSDTLDQNGVPVNPRAFFAPNTREIIAVAVVQGVEVGNKLTGSWYQLGTENAGAEGQFINSKELTLDAVQEGRAIVNFRLTPGTSGFPEDSWLLRIYSGETLIKTAGFIITRAAQASASPAPTTTGGQPPASPTPTAYTVVTGDTLNAIVTRFKPSNESDAAFLTRLTTLNNLPTNATLAPGQIIRIPPANP